MLRKDLSALRAAAWLFPFDIRYRRGPSEYVLNIDNQEGAIRVLKLGQADDPYSPTLAQALMFHMLQVGDKQGASEQFRRLYALAPNAAVTKQLLARLREP